MTSTSINYFIQSCKILEKYSLSSMLEGITVESINCLIHEHEKILRAVDSYEKALELGNSLVTKMSGYNIKITTFISSESDLRSLYSVLIAWRDSVLPRIEKV